MGVELTKIPAHILIVILVLHFSFFVNSSSSNQDSINISNVDSHKHSTSSLPCFDRYALESFFLKYDSFTDSNFLEYMGRKILVGSDTPFATLLHLERHLIGEGSHRRLSSFIRFNIHSDLIADFSPQTCDVIIIERLPSGVFADPFELQHLLHRGVLKDAAVFGDTNLELPSFLSNQSIVEVHLEAALNNSAGQEVMLEFKIDIPLHARYPPLEESGYSKIRFGAPDLFLHCKMDGKSPSHSCVLSPITSSDGLGLTDIVWSIPTGIKAHSKIVYVLTFASALLSATSIIIVSLQSSHMEYKGRLKQS